MTACIELKTSCVVVECPSNYGRLRHLEEFPCVHWTILTLHCMDDDYTCLSSQDGDSALMTAAWWGRTEVVKELVKAGAQLDLQNKVCQQYNTQLLYIMYRNTCIQLLTCKLKLNLTIHILLLIHVIY